MSYFSGKNYFFNLQIMGTTDNIQVKIEAQMTEFFFNQTEHGFAETRQSALKFREKVLQKCDTRIRNL